MNVIFTCGGTAGHVNPALALAGFLRERDPKTRILFVGAERGLERDPDRAHALSVPHGQHLVLPPLPSAEGAAP